MRARKGRRETKSLASRLPLLVSGGTCVCLAASPGSSWRSYDRSRGRDRRSRGCDATGRGCDRRGPRRSSCTGRRCRCTWCAWLPGRRYRRSSAVVVVARVLGVAGTTVFAASTTELRSGVAVRVQVPVGVRVGARCCPSHRDPARRGGQCGHRHETHERLLHSITSLSGLFASRPRCPFACLATPGNKGFADRHGLFNARDRPN